MAQLWFKFWAKEYLADAKIRALSWEKRGMLQTLWCFAWEEGSIPSDPEALGMMLGGLSAKAMRTHMGWIMRFFSVDPADASRLVSPRLEIERQEADARGSKARESAMQRWSKRNANAYANASETHEQTQCESDADPMPEPCLEHAGQGQGTENTSPLPPKGERKGRKSAENLGDYPEELHQAVSEWRSHLKAMETLGEQFREDERYLAKQCGAIEATWRAWQRRTEAKVRGHRVTNADVLSAVRMWVKTQQHSAYTGQKCHAPMLSTLINGDGFVDALVRVVGERLQAEVVDAAS